MTKKSKDVRLKQLLRLGICVALIALIALIGAVMVSAEEPEYSEGLVFVSNGDGTCILKGIGTCTDTEIVIPPVSPEGDVVTEIYSYAIYVLDDLKSITIPASVTKIGEQAFDYCAQLTSIIVEEGNPVYHSDGNCLIHTESKTLVKGCPNSVIPDDGSVTCIGNGAFFDYDNLTSIVIPEGVVSIENDVFSNCNGLTSVTIPSTVTSIGSMFCAYSNLTSITVAEGNPVYHCEGNCLIHTESKTVIGGCSNSVIPADGSVASIGKAAFEGRTSLKSIVIPSSVSKIDWEAFEGCSGLASVTFEKGSQLVTIEDFAFAGCRSLKSIDIPEGVTILKDFTFAACENLESISFSSDLQFIDGCTFSNCEKLIQMENGFGYVNNWVITSEADIMWAKLRDGTVGIAASAFLPCKKMTCIVIPSSVRIINDWMFAHIDHLRHIYYGGTENEWESKFVRGETDYLSSCFIHYNATFDAQGIVYVSNGDGTCYVIGLNPYMAAEIVIPSESPAGDSVTSIGFRAFAGTTSLKSVVIPSSVSKIDWEAFEGSSGLTSVTFSPNSRLTVMEDFSFAGCSSLTSFIIPDGVTRIPGLAFAQCRSMTSITIPDSVTSIGSDAFNWCDNLTDVFYEGTEVQWKAIAIEAYNDPLLNATIHYNTTLDENGIAYTSNGDGTCYVSGIGTCTDTELIIPPVSPAGDTVTAIGGGAFYNCVSLETVMVPASVTHIQFMAFKGCTGLTSVQFAGTSQLTSIESEAFMGCKNLENFTIPASVNNIMGGTLDECPKLIDFEDGVGYVDQWAVTSDSDIAQLILREDTVGIAWGAFASCENLFSVSFPESVKYINESAFGGCSSLTDVVIPAGVVTLQQAVFNQCYSLTSAWILTNDPSAFQSGVFVNSGLDYAYLVGTEEEWKDFVKSAFYTGDRYRDVTIYYNTTFDVSGIAYTSNGDGTCYVSGSSIVVGPDVVIPSVSPAGDLVTRIGNSAFNSRRNLTSIVIPSGVIHIGEAAFCGCSNLTSVTFSEGLEYIDVAAFDSCGKLTSVSFPNSLKGIGVFAFLGCGSLNNVVWPDNGTRIGISTAAFAFCDSLTSFTFPDGLTHVAVSVIENCKNLTSIYIPISVQAIQPLAVIGCDSLTDVYYEGTEVQWKAIAIEEDNDPLLNATIHYLGDLFDLTSASLTLGDSLTMNYYAKADPSYGTPAMRFTYRGKTEYVTGVPTETEGEYVFSLKGIAPQCMGENIKAELILTLEDGTELVVDTKASYSIRQYCDDALAANPDNKALATLLADLLAYGDAAQDYTGFNADTPVSEGFAAAPSEWEAVTDTDFTLSDKTRDDIRFTSAGVRFGHVNRLYFKVKAADLTGVTLTVNGKTYTAEDLALVEDTTDTYILYTDPIYATEFDKVFTAELSVDGEVIQTLTYSVRSYVYAKQNSENTEMAALVRALYAYGRSAIAYKQEQ